MREGLRLRKGLGGYVKQKQKPKNEKKEKKKEG
jgi:hypothetical protein